MIKFGIRQSFDRIDQIEDRYMDVSVPVEVALPYYWDIYEPNGRIGRILIPLFLYQKKKLFSPMFYLSAYLEKYRDEYYAGLNNISEKRD